MQATASPATKSENYWITSLDQVPSVRCPCGHSRRAFADHPGAVASMHLVDISIDARTHYHKKLTEMYLILETNGPCHMELDGQRVPVQPLTAIYIKPGCRHRAVGNMKIINVPIPAFDPDDEWFD